LTHAREILGDYLNRKKDSDEDVELCHGCCVMFNKSTIKAFKEEKVEFLKNQNITTIQEEIQKILKAKFIKTIEFVK